MSSTNRGADRSRDDFYETPAWCVHRLLDRLEGMSEGFGLFFGVKKVLDPCAGNGAIFRAIKSWEPKSETAPLFFDLEFRAVEINDGHQGALLDLGAETTIADYFRAADVVGDVDLVITNPPFIHAQRFVETSLRYAKKVAMLLRLNFLGSEERHALLTRNPPDVYVLPNRPSFVGGGTDSIEYAWFVWERRGARAGLVQVLDLTPLAERKAGRDAA